MMIVGKCPWRPAIEHVWLLVETDSGKYMPVEATQYRLVESDDAYFDSYLEYDYSFETILEALNHNYEEFNWWDSYEEFNWRENSKKHK